MPSDPSEFVRLPEYGEWELQEGLVPLGSVRFVLMGSDKNRDPGPTRDKKKHG